MRKFLLTTGVFTAGFIILNLLLYLLFFHQKLYKDYIVSAKEIGKYRFFLFSDSHGMVLDQTLLDQSGIYNFSYGSDSYRDIYFKIKYILANDIRPDAVIITADDHTLSKYRNHMNNKLRSINYADYSTYSESYPGSFFKYLYIKYGYRYLPMLNPNNSSLFNKFVISKMEYQARATDSNVNWVDRNDKESKSRIRKKAQFPNKKMSVQMSDALTDILILCEQNNIKVFGLLFPLAKNYLDVLDGASFHADSIFIANSCQILDYKEIFAGNDSLFMDHDHLNKKGAKRFVGILRKAVDTNTISSE